MQFGGTLVCVFGCGVRVAMVVGAEMGEAADIRVPNVPLAHLDDDVDSSKSLQSLVMYNISQKYFLLFLLIFYCKIYLA